MYGINTEREGTDIKYRLSISGVDVSIITVTCYGGRKQVEIQQCYTNPHYRRRGYATHLVNHIREIYPNYNFTGLVMTVTAARFWGHWDLNIPLGVNDIDDYIDYCGELDFEGISG